MFELDFDLARDVFGAPHFGRHRAAQQRDTGPRALAQPGAIELMVPGGRAEVPQDRLVILRQQSEAADLVLRPGADVRGGDVAHVVHVEAQQCAHLRFRQQGFGACQALAAQAVHIDALLPIHRHGSVSLQCHDSFSSCRLFFAAEGASRLEHRLLGGDGDVLERRRERNGNMHRSHALHGRFQIEERVLR